MELLCDALQEWRGGRMKRGAGCPVKNLCVSWTDGNQKDKMCPTMHENGNARDNFNTLVYPE